MNAASNETDLPVTQILPRLGDALRDHPIAIVSAPPGAGKSTVLPLQFIHAPLFAGKRILLVQPRRVAATAVASRMAQLLNENVGETVGYQVRYQRKIGADTRLEVVTDGILLQRLQKDPALEQYGLVILDEFHERRLNTDLALAFCRDSQGALRDDLKILLMSATMDHQRFAAQTGAPVVEVDVKTFPLQISYGDTPLNNTDFCRYERDMNHLVRRALLETEGDVLVFLPGVRDIRRLEKNLQDIRETEVLPLYGELSLDRQRRVLERKPGDKRRVILSTNVAETSVTIDGIEAVVDSGLVKVMRFDAKNGLTHLRLEHVTRASADQRCGRAGRLGPGKCFRAWRESDHHRLIRHPHSEISDCDLSTLVLELAQWGVTSLDALEWIERPPQKNFDEARRFLTTLGALDQRGQLTSIGQEMSGLPLDPRLARMLVTARRKNLGALACDIAAILSERDFMPPSSGADVRLRVDALLQWRKRGEAADTESWRFRQVDRISSQLRRLIGVSGSDRSQPAVLIGLLLAEAYPDRIALRRADDDTQYLMVNGRGVMLAPEENLRNEPYLVVTRADAGVRNGRVELAAALDIDTLREWKPGWFETAEILQWDDTKCRVVCYRAEQLNGLTMNRQNIALTDRESAAKCLIKAIRRRGEPVFDWGVKGEQLLYRLRSLAYWQPDEPSWAAFSPERLMADLEVWLQPYLGNVASFEALNRLDLAAILLNSLPWEKQQALEKLAPSRLLLPTGDKRRLAYEPGKAPVLSARIQELFGWLQSPRVCNDRVPVLIQLLSPAQRPVQLTQDLENFWHNTYHDVVKELKGRYPKHYWPDDPLTAKATSRVRPR